MSALWGLAVSGAIPSGAGPIVSWRNGVPFNALGELVVDAVVGIDHRSNGIPFTSTGAVVVNPGGVVDHWSCGLPFDSAGKLVVNTTVTAGYSSGVPFSATGQIEVS